MDGSLVINRLRKMADKRLAFGILCIGFEWLAALYKNVVQLLLL